MSPKRYQNVLHEFDEMLAYGRTVSERLTGRKIPSRDVSYADAIYTKLLCHGISLRKLSPSLSERNELWDMPSAAAVARSLIEAFDALAYIGTRSITENEREFRVLLWKLHDQQRRLQMLERVRSTNPKVAEIRVCAVELVSSIVVHPFYPSISRDLQQKINKGDSPAFHLSQRDLNVENGIDHDYHTTATMFLSQYVHTFPFSLHQLMEFRAGEPEALQLSALPLQYSMAFLAKAIEKMIEIWPEVHVEPSGDLQHILEIWCGIAERGVLNAG
ncbi:MAG: hypothetical protein HOP24_10175 [Sideroxydans sp.]|nr:hypothetical protein [Sideroxydans sp.]